MKKELFKEVYVGKREDSHIDVTLTYYLLTDSVSEEYCDLKVYGVEIDKEEKKMNSTALVEKKIIKDLFFKKRDAVDFLREICENKVMPMELKYAIDDYIGDKVQFYNTEKV